MAATDGPLSKAQLDTAQQMLYRLNDLQGRIDRAEKALVDPERIEQIRLMRDDLYKRYQAMLGVYKRRGA